MATLETLDSREVGAWDTEISDARVAPDLGCLMLDDDNHVSWCHVYVYYLSETAEEGLV